MQRGRRSISVADVVLIASIVALATVFWKVRIFDRGTNPTIELGPIDMYIELIPTFDLVFSTLRSWHFPLWNPYQMCGEPLFAIGWTGALYPPHWIRLVTSIPLSIEILLVFHLALAGIGMWSLARQFELGHLAGLCSAVTFMWSGWLTHNNTQPAVVEVISWTPWVLLALERLALGRSYAWPGLIIALTGQLMIGLIEVFVHSMYAAGIFFACRLAPMAWHGDVRVAVRRAATALGCVAAAVLLAMPLLLPNFELVRQSTRAAGQLSLEQAVGIGAIQPWPFLQYTLENVGAVSVGCLPLIALPSAFGVRRARVLAIAAAMTAIGAAGLIFGGSVYALYYQIPVIGGLFRRPWKFLDIYQVAQAVLVGLAVADLGEIGTSGERAVAARWRWVATLACGLLGILWLHHLGSWNWYLVAALGILVIVGAPVPRWLRGAALLVLCAIQGASLFFVVGDTHVRPLKRPQIFHTHDVLFDHLRKSLGHARVYLSPTFPLTPTPGLTAKQGQLRRMPVVTDYEPLSTARYATFFGRVTTRSDTTTPFYGAYALKESSNWRLMDLTGTKFFVMTTGEPGQQFMQTHPSEFRFVMRMHPATVYERRNVLPRAYFVGRSRTLADADTVLDALDDPDFDARSEVLLEGSQADDLRLAPEGAPTGEASIVADEPERVVVSVHADTPGFLVLADLHYPGWTARVDDRDAPILRANYLFRAVRVDAGMHEVRFEYRPASFRIGLWIGAATLLAIVVVALASRRR